MPDDDMTEDEVRAWLNELHTPKLDAFRTRLRSERTSALLVFQRGDEPIIATTMAEIRDEAKAELEAIGEDADQIALIAVLVAIGDELDRRIPIPGG